MTDRTTHGVLSEFLMRLHVERAVKIICQDFFKFVAKHVVVYDLRRTRDSCSLPLEPSHCPRLSRVHLHYSHTSKYLRKFNSATIHARFNRALRYFQEIDNLLIAQLLDIPKNYAGSQVQRKLVDAGLDLYAKFSPFHFALHGAAGGAQVISVIFQITGGGVLRRALSLAVVVNNQIPRQPHQPILQVTLLGVVLIEGTINPYEYFLGQVFGGVCSGGKSIGKVVNPSRVRLHNLFPRRAVARATSSNQFSSGDSQASCGPQFESSPFRGTEINRRVYPARSGL